MQTITHGKFFHVKYGKLMVRLCLKINNLIVSVSLLFVLLFLDSYGKARQMLPMAEDTDGLDTDKETGRGMRKKKKNQLFDDDDDNEEEEEDHVHVSKQKEKTFPVPPKSTYKIRQTEIRNNSSVRNALQKLKTQRVEKKNRNEMNTINEKSQTENEMVVDIQEMPEKRCTENISMELEKARKRIQERKQKDMQEKEVDAYIQKKAKTSNKENQINIDQYDSQLKSPDFRAVSPG